MWMLACVHGETVENQIEKAGLSHTAPQWLQIAVQVFTYYFLKAKCNSQ